MNRKLVLKITPILFVLLTYYCWADFSYKVIFANPLANYVFATIVASVTPLTIILASINFSRRLVKVSGVIVGILSGFLFLPAAFMSGVMANDIYTTGVDPSYEEISSLAQKQKIYRLYRTNCGATCAFGLSLREESNSFLGLKIIKYIWSEYGPDEGVLKISKGKLTVVGWNNEVLMSIK